MEPSTRKVVTRSPSHSVRVLHLPHLQPEPVHADSNPERYFAQIAALYPFIGGIKHQPFKLRLGDHSYTPDFLLTFTDDSRLVVEVKPASKLEGYRKLFEEAKEQLNSFGIEFLVARDVDMTKERLASRALRIRRYSKTSYSEAECQRVVDLVRAAPEGIRMSDLKVVHGVLEEVIFHLMAFRRICSRVTLEISPTALITTPEQLKRETKNATQAHAVQFGIWFSPETWGEDD